MKLTKYNKIVEDVGESCGTDTLLKIYELYPEEPHDRLTSIFSYSVQQRVKKNWYKFGGTWRKGAALYERYCESVDRNEGHGIINRIAENLHMSPSMIARVILEQYISETTPLEDSINSMSSTGSTSVKSQVKKLFRNTNLIDDKRLSLEVFLSNIEDEVYGPHSEAVKHAIGANKEQELQRRLDELNISYIGEDEMRLQGFDKTPDIKLDQPIAVDGHIINWIESKALFGNPDNHAVYLNDQLRSYWNRFGSGLVIYWFGYVDELEDCTDKGILIREKFPDNFTKYDPNLI